MKPFEVLILPSALQAGPPVHGWGSQSREKAELELLTPSDAGSHPLGMRVHTVYQRVRAVGPHLFHRHRWPPPSSRTQVSKFLFALLCEKTCSLLSWGWSCEPLLALVRQPAFFSVLHPSLSILPPNLGQIIPGTGGMAGSSARTLLWFWLLKTLTLSRKMLLGTFQRQLTLCFCLLYKDKMFTHFLTRMKGKQKSFVTGSRTFLGPSPSGFHTNNQTNTQHLAWDDLFPPSSTKVRVVSCFLRPCSCQV